MTHTPAIVGDLEHGPHDSLVVRFRDHAIPDAFITLTSLPETWILGGATNSGTSLPKVSL